MPRHSWTALAGVLSIVVMALVSANQVEVSPGGKVTIDPLAADLGKVLQGDVASASFHIRNASATAVDLYELSKSCSCTEVVFSTHHLEKGEEAVLRLKISVGDRFRKFQSAVEIGWKAKSGAGSGELTALVSLEAAKIASVNPVEVSFGSIDHLQEEFQKQIQVSGGDTSFRWSSINAVSDAFGPLGTERIGTHDVVTYKLRPKGRPVGVFKDRVQLRFLGERGETLRTIQVPVTARIRSNIQIAPKSIYLGVVDPKSTVNGECVLTSLNGQAIQLIQARAGDQSASVRTTQPDAKTLVISYRKMPGAIPGPLNDNISVQLGGDRAQTILIPVVGFVGG